MAEHLVYLSHETFTSTCANVETQALRNVFGAAAKDIVISNTKQSTGHLMGACYEDICAVLCLQQQRAPKVCIATVDPEFEDLTFSTGERHPFRHALHMALGMGSQVACVLYSTG